MEEGGRFFDICIFCALHQEAAALLAEFEARCQISFTRAFSRRTRYVYYCATIKNQRAEPLHVLVSWPSQHGPVQTAIDLVRLLDEFRPRFAAMSGICAGDRREVRLGDVIVASCAYLYEEGKIVSGPDGQAVHLLETTSLATTSQVLQYIQGFWQWQAPLRALRQNWPGGSGEQGEEPRCLIAAMASGMAVRSDDPFPWLRERYHRHVLGLDMEAASFYRALGTDSQIHALVVKGVSDYADQEKDDRFHQFAARASAIYLLHFIQEYVTNENMPRAQHSPDPGQALSGEILSDQFPAAEGMGLSAQLWTVPYRQNRYFVGRESLLARISTAFAAWESRTTPVVVLTGLGGVGKTQTALEYAYRTTEEYQAIFWVNASSQETFLADLVSLSRTLGISAPQEQDAAGPDHLHLVRNWLAQHRGWLLILDALSDVSLIFTALPVRSVGHVLATTQQWVSQTLARVYDVGPLAEQEALSLLLLRSGVARQQPGSQLREERAAAVRLCQHFDGLPLALDQAGAYIEQTGCSLGEYEQRYHTCSLPLLQKRGDAAMDHPASVVATWALTFQQVEARHPAAADLLRTCAFLAPAVIPQMIFQQGARQLGPHLADLEADPTSFDAAISTLRLFSFIRRDSHTRTLSLHRLVQLVLCALLPADQQVLWAGRAVQALCAAFPRRQEPDWAHCAFYLAHVTVCEELVARYQLSLPILGTIVYRAGRFFHEHGQYQEATAYYTRARQFCQALPATADADGLPQILESLGWLALGQRHFLRAQAYLDEAWTLKRQIYGPDHLETAHTLHTLGRVAHAQHQSADAERFYRQALAIKEQTLGREHAETATTLLALGWLMFDQQRYPQAAQFYQQALQIRLTVLGLQHVSTAVVLHLQARLAQRQEQYHRAERLFLQALAIKERTLCADHPSLAITLQALARLYHKQRRLSEAHVRYMQALRIREQMLGSEHLLTAETLHALARCYQEQEQQSISPGGQEQPLPVLSPPRAAAQERLSEAERLYRRVLAIRRQALGWKHPSVQTVIQEYAHLLNSEQRESEARALLEEQQATEESSAPF